MPKPPPLSVSEASTRTHIPKRTLQHVIAKGELKAHKLAGLTGSYVIEQRDLETWLARRESKAS